MSVLIGQTLVENAKIQMQHFELFQTMYQNLNHFEYIQISRHFQQLTFVNKDRGKADLEEKFDNFEVPCEVMHHWKALLVVFSYRTRIALGLGFVRVHQEVGQFV